MNTDGLLKLLTRLIPYNMSFSKTTGVGGML